jgi:hypothetical protein
MAKLSDLRSLLDKARTQAKSHAPKHAQHVNGSGKRALAATKHADGDIDIHHVFADVTRLPAAKKVGVGKPRPAPLPQQTMLDERNALHAAKYGTSPRRTPGTIGQELEGEQTFLRAGLGTDVLTGLRRGRWVVQGGAGSPSFDDT